METKTIQIEEKIKGLIAESLGDKFIASGDKIIDRNKLIEELTKTEQYYKYLFGFSVSAVTIISIVTVLRFFSVFPAAGEGNAMILLFGILGVSSASYQYKIKMEKLRTAVYLCELKAQMEDLKVSK